jgi:uncharacterized protein (DUF697 family)
MADPPRPERPERPEHRWGPLARALGLGDWHQLWDDVEHEGRTRVGLVGLPGVGKSTLFNRLRGWEVSPLAGQVDGTGPTGLEDLGVFRLDDLPADGPSGAGWIGDPDEPSQGIGLAGAALVVFVLDASVGARPAEYRWLSGVRAAGRPTVVVLNKVDLVGDGLAAVRREVEQRLGTPVLPISAGTGAGVDDRLLPRLLRTSPHVAVPLGRELPWARRAAARSVIHRAAIASALAGAVPVPLVDLSAQVATQQRLVTQLAVLYAQPPAAAREALAALAGTLGARLAAQQGAKLVPVVGWVASPAAAGLATWLLGWAAVAYYERRAADDGPQPAAAAAGLARSVRQAAQRRLAPVRRLRGRVKW